jgi:hypothetical protein
MDFATRDRYRHVVEKIAKESPLSESEVAQKAIQLAHEGAEGKGSDDRAAHVGFYLIDKGLPQLEEMAHVRLTLSGILRKVGSRVPLFVYLSTITLITLTVTMSLLAKTRGSGLHDWLLALIAILSLLCASHMAVALANWMATLLAKPHVLPRMDLCGGIPPESRTLVVVPTMLTSAQNIEDLIEALEVRFLGNRDENLHFGLLTDFQDAHTETMPEDEPLLGLAQKRIEELNEKYGGVKGDMFFLFHRPRRWNPRERIWMGYERKRGKLAALNALLRGGLREPFSCT